MKAIHNFTSGNFAPLGLVVRVGQDGQEDLVGEELEMFKWRGAAKLADDQLKYVIEEAKEDRNLTSLWMLSIFRTQGLSFTKRSTFPFKSFEGIILSNFIDSGTTRHLFSSKSQNC
jgi:hypothetical protein